MMVVSIFSFCVFCFCVLEKEEERGKKEEEVQTSKGLAGEPALAEGREEAVVGAIDGVALPGSREIDRDGHGGVWGLEWSLGVLDKDDDL